MRHAIEVTIEGSVIGGWTEYEFTASMIEPADTFRLTRGFDLKAWRLCRKDAAVLITIDKVPMLSGFIDARAMQGRAGTFTIEGRDKGGRLIQESIPKPSGFDGLTMVELIKRLVDPWFSSVTLSAARDRAVRLGKGKKAAVGAEPAILTAKNITEESSGRLDPGEMRYNAIEGLLSSVGLMCWAGVDGREFVVGMPNYKQQPQYLIRYSLVDSTEVEEILLEESIADAYSEIEVHGTSPGDEDNEAGDLICSGSAKDGPAKDGTGNNFLRPKRLVMSQTSLTSNAEAVLVAKREMRRRLFKLRHYSITMTAHGQVVAGSTPTLYAPNTIARVINHLLEEDDLWLVYACRYKGSRGGATTDLSLVPVGTEFVP